LRTSTKPRAATSASYVERVNRAIDYVVSNLREPLRLSDLSRAARLSPFHFHRVFQALVGETPADFVKLLRLDLALRLMARPRPPSLTAIALDCGFSSSSDFTRSFKQRFGVPPSVFNIKTWQAAHAEELESRVAGAVRLERLPPRSNPDQFRVKIRELPARSVAYIRVDRPYHGDRVVRAVHRLMDWADNHGLGDNQWLGYQWENPEITSLDECRYYVAVEAESFPAKGEIGRFHFPPMTVAEIEMRGGIDLELRALKWLYTDWLPRSGAVPDDHPGFEAWIGRPFAHGHEFFALHLQVPIRRA
jgi:AraC family transcriptional regulator